MPEVTNEGVSLYYSDEGDGIPVVLLHGHTLDHRVFDWLVGDLKAAGLRLVRPDLRGHGRSHRPDSGYHWVHHASDVIAILDDAKVDRAAVVGYSLGGGIGLEMALESPDRVDRLVLLSPVLPDRPWEPEFMDNLKAVARAVRSDGVTAAMMGPWMSSPLWSGALDPKVQRKLEEILRDFPGADYLASERDRVDRDWTVPERLNEIEAPTLVIVGEREMAGFRAFSNEIAGGIPGARLDVLEDQGHLHPLEAPEVVAAMVVDHLTDE